MEPANTQKTNTYPTKFFAAVIVVVVIFVAIVLVVQSNSKNPGLPQPTSTPATEITTAPLAIPSPITYQGEEGKTALDILKNQAAIETSGEGANTFVLGINGYRPDQSTAFWAFYVNGTQAPVGAGAYKTKATDTIEWRVEEVRSQ